MLAEGHLLRVVSCQGHFVVGGLPQHKCNRMVSVCACHSVLRSRSSSSEARAPATPLHR